MWPRLLYCHLVAMDSLPTNQNLHIQAKAPDQAIVFGFTKKELIIGGVSILVWLILFGFLWWYEGARARDAMRVSNVVQVRSALDAYYQRHSTYPASGVDGLIVGTTQSTCLSDAGFVSMRSSKCQTPIFGAPLLGGLGQNNADYFIYHATSADGKECQDVSGCASYQLQFNLETSAMRLASGSHLASPQGVQ